MLRLFGKQGYDKSDANIQSRVRDGRFLGGKADIHRRLILHA